MELREIILTTIVCGPGLFLTIGSYILQRDRYWTRVWKQLGEPEVESVNELKSLMKERRQTVKRGASQDETRSASVM